MSKNATRKGIALGAASALLISGFAGIPASAAGLADTTFVSLVPNVGKEYAVITGNSKEFALKANASSSVYSTGAYLKFLVADSTGEITADITAGGSKSTLHTRLTDESDTVATKSGQILTVTTTAAHLLKNGDLVTLKGTSNNTGLSAVDARVAVTVTGSTTFTVDTGNATALSGILHGDITVTLAPNAIDTLTDTFVYQTRADSALSDQVLVLETDSSTAVTRTVTVTAWIDGNGNDEIDATEYASPVRTVSWLANADITAVTTLTYPTAADASVGASVALTPNLNEEQMSAGDVQIGFTRPGSTATVYSNATQDNTTRAWSATQSLETGNWVGMPHIAQVQSVADGAPNQTITLDKTLGLSIGDIVVVAETTSADNATSGADVTAAESALVFAADEADFGSVPAVQGSAAGYVRTVSKVATGAAVADKVTFTTGLAHGLSIGDIVTTSGATGNTTVNLSRAAVTSVPSATTFTLEDDAITTGTVTGSPVVTFVSFKEAVAGTYTAKTKVASVAIGNTSTNVTVSNTSDDTTLATTATANVQGVSNSDATSTSPYTTAYVRKGQTEVELTATIVDVVDVAVTAGRTVKVSLENLESSGTPAKSGTFKINGTTYTSAVYLKTDASGKVTFTVSDDDGATTTKARVLVVPENLSGAKTADIELVWSAAVYTLFDLNDNAAAAETGHNSVVSGGSYTYSLAVMDQWKEAPAAGSHRVKYVSTGNTVETNYVTLTNGRGTYTVTDNKVGSGSSISTAFTVEKLGTDGVTWTQQDLLNDGDTDGSADTVTYTTSVVSATATFAVLLDSDGSTAYGSGAAADLSNTANTVELAPQDRRVANLVQPVYTANNRVTGRVANATTNAPRAGAEVTITGPASILFSEGATDALGSLTVKTDAAGEFGIILYSSTVQTDTVITVTSGASSKTVKVSFTGQGASFGTAWVITAPAYAKPGSTFQVKAKLTDKFNNPVQVSTAGDVKVTYTGPGLIVGTLPNVTDKNGELTFSVLLGSNDTGAAVVTVSYDQNSDDDFVDAKDLVVGQTITVGTAPASADQKVNAGSFKGYVALYAKGYAGQRMSAKVGNDWVVVPVLASNFERVVEFTGAGYTVAVRIYIDRVLIDTITVTTK